MKIKTRRALSFLIDYWIIDVLILTVLGILNYDENVLLFGGIMFITTSIYLIFKDVFGRSIGKTIMRLEIVSSNRSQTSAIVRILRNLTLIVYPVEILCVLLRNDGKRISDLIFGTEVVLHEDFSESAFDRSNVRYTRNELFDTYTVSSTSKVVLVVRRVMAAIIDYFIIAVVIAFLFVIFESFGLNAPMEIIVGLVAFAMYFKDLIFGGASLGKRITKLRVMKQDLSDYATVKMHLVRSIFVFLYPVEIIVMLISGQRIGDYVSGSRVICIRKHY
jgi:uncharacterized RDD family membrane protein YckC